MLDVLGLQECPKKYYDELRRFRDCDTVRFCRLCKKERPEIEFCYIKVQTKNGSKDVLNYINSSRMYAWRKSCLPCRSGIDTADFYFLD